MMAMMMQYLANKTSSAKVREVKTGEQMESGELGKEYISVRTNLWYPFRSNKVALLYVLYVRGSV